MATTQPQLAAALAETAAATPTSIAAIFDAANRELTARGTAPGLDVGDPAPGFALPDQLGRVVSLGERLAHGPVVLVFYRGDWCPYCNLTLRALQLELEAIRAQGAQLLAVSPQTPDNALTLTERHGLEFPVLSDVSQATIAAYGLRYAVPVALQELYLKFGNDLRERNADGTWSLPVPATFVVDRRGVIRARFVEMDFTKRMEPADVVSALAETVSVSPE
jgi:peroxiredoxin